MWLSPGCHAMSAVHCHGSIFTRAPDLSSTASHYRSRWREDGVIKWRVQGPTLTRLLRRFLFIIVIS
jgi:hypothetical protein